MELTREQAIDYSVKIWEELAETGGDLEEKHKVASQYGVFQADCPLCEVSLGICSYCPYRQEFGECVEAGYYDWAGRLDVKGRKSWAKTFLAQLLYLQHKYSVSMPKSEKLVDVTQECVIRLCNCEGTNYITLSYDNEWLAEFGVNKTRINKSSGFIVEEQRLHELMGFKIMKRASR